MDRVLDSIQTVHDGIHGFWVRSLRLQHLIRHRIDAVRLAYGIQAVGRVLLPTTIDAALHTLDFLVHPALVLIVLILLIFDHLHRLHDLLDLGVLVELGASHVRLDRLLEILVWLVIGLLKVEELLSDVVVLLAHLFVQNVVAHFRLQVLHVDLVDVLFHIVLDRPDVWLNGLLDEAESAFPNCVTFFATIGDWLDDKEVVVLVLSSVLIFNDNCVVAHDGQLCHETELRLVLEHTSESITHDCNEHVKEGDLGEEGRQDEEEVTEDHLRMIIVPFHLEFTERQHVLVVEHVDDELPEDLRQNVILTLRHIELEHVERATEGWKRAEEDKDEPANIVDRLCDQPDEEGRFLEKTKPVQNFDPHEEKRESCNDALSLEWWNLDLEHGHDYNPQRWTKTIDVNQVVDAGEVFPERDANTLDSLNVELPSERQDDASAENVLIQLVPEVVLLCGIALLQNSHVEVHGAEHPAGPWDKNLHEDLVEVVLPEFLQQDVEQLSLVNLVALLPLEDVDEIDETVSVRQ